MSTQHVSKRAGPMSFPGDREDVRAFLLQRHQSLLHQSILTQCINRVLFVLFFGFVVVGFPIAYQSAMLTLTGGILLFSIWLLEATKLRRELGLLEETLARSTGGDWEDAFIRSKRVDAFLSMTRQLYIEPWMWFMALSAAVLITITHLHGGS